MVICVGPGDRWVAFVGLSIPVAVVASVANFMLFL